jgi:hypothetical protein
MSRCQHHKTKFEAKYFNQKFCLSDDECIKAFNESVKANQQKQKAKDWQKEKKEIKEKLMTLSDWQKLLEKEVNHIARLIDKDSGCISCGGHTTPQGGHYHSVKSNGSIRFNLDNIHLQDYNCNCAQGSNTPMYDLGIIERYGKQYWEYMKFDIVRLFTTLKMAKFEYSDKITIARSIVKHLQLENKTYNESERLELRKKFNAMIGIYV